MSGPLKPPRINTEDPGAHDLEDSSDDHFSSASEGTPNPSRQSVSSAPHSPIPTTRVERVDDRALHGEVPGTSAYELRTQDAVPDEIEIVPEGTRSRSATQSGGRGRSLSQLNAEGGGDRSETPGGSPIPKTVVEKVDEQPSYGEVEGTSAKEMRMADALPDEVRQAPEEARVNLEGRGQEIDENDEEGRQEWFRSMWEGKPAQKEAQREDNGAMQDVAGSDDNDFGDDFDDFAEGEEGADEDFGDFDEGEEEAASSPTQMQPVSQTTTPNILSSLPPLDLSSCNSETEIHEAIKPYINAILPNSSPVPSKKDLPPLDASTTSSFLSDRSLSLWQQLVSPPPMQPPNWTRSRIRRLFLVSLGVPVDLDEILPPSKQKRLILPNVNFDRVSPRPSTALDRLRDQDANASSTSLDSKGQPKPHSRSRQRKGPPPPPEFDTNAATLLSATTEEALSVYSDGELKGHVMTLHTLNEKASKVLEYWLQRKDEGLKEKEALEGVIENLVGFVKGRRGGGK